MIPINSDAAWRRESDIMPRSFALTLIAGSLIGTGFWGLLTMLLVR